MASSSRKESKSFLLYPQRHGKQILAATDYLTDAINSTSFFARIEIPNNDPGLAFSETQLVSSLEWNGHHVNASQI